VHGKHVQYVKEGGENNARDIKYEKVIKGVGRPTSIHIGQEMKECTNKGKVTQTNKSHICL